MSGVHVHKLTRRSIATPITNSASVASRPRRSVQPYNFSSGSGAYSHGSRRSLFLKFRGGANYINKAWSSEFRNHLDHFQNSENEKKDSELLVRSRKKNDPPIIFIYYGLSIICTIINIWNRSIGVHFGFAKSTCHNLLNSIPYPFH